MSDANNGPVVYVYRGNEGEEVPNTAEKLIVEEGVQVLPEMFCYGYERLQEVTLPNRLKRIEEQALFTQSKNLLEINFGSAIEYIGEGAFRGCDRLKKVEFDTTSTSQQLSIGDLAFFKCISLQRIRLPSCWTSLDNSVFDSCQVLIEANLSATFIMWVPAGAFESCFSLQTVSLPNTMEEICEESFKYCYGLVTVVIPPESQPISIGPLLAAFSSQTLSFQEIPVRKQTLLLIVVCYTSSTAKIVLRLSPV